jgi:hypothetical protein
MEADTVDRGADVAVRTPLGQPGRLPACGRQMTVSLCNGFNHQSRDGNPHYPPKP